MKDYLVIMAALLLSGLNLNAQQTRKINVEGWEVNINKRQPINKVIAFMGVKPGMVIGEVGAGTGRVTVWLADAVGSNGTIYANDIDKGSLDDLKKRCEKEGLLNVKSIVGAVDDPKLPIAALDIAFMTNTYHHLDKPIDLVKKLRLSLKPTGYLVIVERDKDRCPISERDEATSIADFKKQMKSAGFEVTKIDTTMRVDNMYLAVPIW